MIDVKLKSILEPAGTRVGKGCPLKLSENDDACLQAIVKKGSDWRERERAETILLLASGASVKAIGKQQRICREAVRIRRRKWL
ncbi:helix-turn-helix domain-containing protein, partial [Methylomicrobium sp. Wu6]|uniref:helix-turn-helix domain-containing protein n=1 Tax=Methylomicrobium sp. Wu6 TaxID=3107928 RepID=UPI002DD6740C